MSNNFMKSNCRIFLIIWFGALGGLLLFIGIAELYKTFNADHKYTSKVESNSESDSRKSNGVIKTAILLSLGVVFSLLSLALFKADKICKWQQKKNPFVTKIPNPRDNYHLPKEILDTIPTGWLWQPIPSEEAGHIISEIEELVYNTWKYDHRIGKDAANLSHSSIQINSVFILHNKALISKYNESKSCLEAEAEGYFSGIIPRLKGIKGQAEIMTAYTTLNLAVECCDKSMTKTFGINEEYLFHGTKLNNISEIMKSGFKLDLASSGLYGKALYLAESSEKADQYTDSFSNRRHTNLCMIIARTALGRTYIHQDFSKGQVLSSLPCTKRGCFTQNCFRHKEKCHSAVAGMDKRFREFMLHNTDRCYPHIFVFYDRKDEHRVHINSNAHNSSHVQCFLVGTKEDIESMQEDSTNLNHSESSNTEENEYHIDVKTMKISGLTEQNLIEKYSKSRQITMETLNKHVSGLSSLETKNTEVIHVYNDLNSLHLKLNSIEEKLKEIHLNNVKYGNILSHHVFMHMTEYTATKKLFQCKNNKFNKLLIQVSQ